MEWGAVCLNRACTVLGGTFIGCWYWRLTPISVYLTSFSEYLQPQILCKQDDAPDNCLILVEIAADGPDKLDINLDKINREGP
jgi:hypothetical protein